MDHKIKQGVDFAAYSAIQKKNEHLDMGLSSRWEFTARDKDGNVLWKDYFDNLVVSVGLDNVLSEYFKGAAYTAAHYMGLTSDSPTTSANATMSVHAGFVEVLAYDEAVRQTVQWATVTGQQVANSVAGAVFTISVNGTTIGGAFVTTDDGKDDSVGVLYGYGAFTGGNKSLDDDDTLTVTITATAAAS